MLHLCDDADQILPAVQHGGDLVGLTSLYVPNVRLRTPDTQGHSVGVMGVIRLPPCGYPLPWFEPEWLLGVVLNPNPGHLEGEDA